MSRFTPVLLLASVGKLVLLDRDLERRRRRRRRPPVPETPDVVDLPEPPGLVYDNRPPCPLPGLEQNPPPEGEGCVAPFQVEPKGVGVPFAEGEAEPAWPVSTTHKRNHQVSYKDKNGIWHGKWGRHFGASRKSSDGEKRRHAGVDLFGKQGDIVRAMEPGEIIGIFPFHHGAWAVYELTETGIIINYGEIAKKSWREFGIAVGAPVEAGTPIGRLGEMYEDTMLHMETYAGDTTMADIRRSKMRWTEPEAPVEVLDPTEQLVLASWRAQGALG